MTSTSPIISSNVSLRQEPSHMMAHTNGPGSTLGQHYQHHVTHGQRGHSVLVEGKLLQGEALLEYAQQKGLCPKCVQHVTHKRVRKKVGMLRYTFEWIPLTCTDEQAGNYTVYKGYCLQPTCFTLEEAQNLLGEHQRMRITRSTSRGRVHNRASQSRSSSKARPSSSKSRSRRDLSNGVSNSMSSTSHHSSISGASSEADGDTDRDFESDDYDVECVAISQSESFTDSSTRPITPTSSIPNSPSSGDVQHIQQQPNRQRLMQPQLLTNQRLAMQRSPGRTLSCHNLDANSCRTPRASDRTKRRVPDSDILRQLCRLLADFNNDTPSGHGGVNSRRGIAKGKSARGPLSVASESDLWTILHKRYGEETLPALTIPGRIVVILSILHKPFVMEGSNSDDNKEHNECSEPAWTLLAHLTKQQLQLANAGEDDNESSNLNSETSPKQKARFAEQLLRQISNEFDRTDTETTDSHHSSSDLGYAKRCAAQTLYYMLKNEERCVDSPVLSRLQALSPTKRHHWIAVLLDMLLFNGDDDDQLIGSGDEAEHKSQAGTAENLYVVWNLLLADDADTTSTHDNIYVLKTIVGIAASILSNYSTEDGCCCNGLYSSSRGASIIESVLQVESAMGLLATVASRAGATALAGRQYECLQAISETCTRYDDVDDVLLQGSHAICHILACFEWYHDDSSGGGSINESTERLPRCYAAAEHVLDVVSLVLEYQKKRAQRGLPKPEELNRAVCRLLTTLLEANEILQTFVVRVCLQQEQLVSSLVQMLGTTSILSIAESASDILVYMLNRDTTTSKCFRETPDIAAVVVHAMNHYREAPVMLENLCVIVAHLASLQDHKLGQEISAAGGINVLADLLMNPPLQGSQYPDDSASMTEVALRALTGIISSIDIKLLHSYQASLVDVFISIMDRQHQQHRIFQCATDTGNKAYEFDINWDCNLALQVQLAVLDALHVLCVRGATGEVSRTIQLVLYNMEFYSEQVEVLTRCCAIIRRLTRKLSENPAASPANNHIADVIATLQATQWGFSLLRAMMFHPDATELVLECMATLKDLAAMPCFRDLFEPSDAEACLVSLLDVTSATRPDVTALAFAALNNVLVDRRLRPSVGPVSEDVVMHMLGALRRFPDDVEVWTNSLLLLKSYTYRDDNLAILHDSYSDELIPLLIDSERILSGDALERATYIIRKLQ